MNEKHRIVIAEDHTIVREGLRALLSSNPAFEIIGEAEDGLIAVRCVEELLPDLLILDLTMPKMNGMEAIKELTKRCSATKILVLTVHRTEEYVFAALQAGAKGYVLKDATHVELLMAIENILQGKSYLSPAVSKRVIEGYVEGKKSLECKSTFDMLTQREKEILKLIAEGYKNKEIADCLCISIKTVDKHRTNLMKKLDLHNASALTTFAIDKGLLVR
ncbi:MAG: response regulator transcription factor [Desulfobulbaceae bacterium]|nr:response regulator transcription factor [Desulfobulbaceae bacterium]